MRKGEQEEQVVIPPIEKEKGLYGNERKGKEEKEERKRRKLDLW